MYTSRVSNFFSFFEIAIGLKLSRVQIGMKTQCKKILENIDVSILRGDFEVYGGSRKYDFIISRKVQGLERRFWLQSTQRYQFPICS